MDKTIYLVRHAQGYHNLENSHHIPDALLTPLGLTQCAELSKIFPHHSTIDLVLASPLRRAVQTAYYSFTPILQRTGRDGKRVRLVLVPMAQEVSSKPCDVGVEREVLEAQIKDILNGDEVHVDFEHVERGWCSKKGFYEDTLKAVEARAATLRKWLFAQPEKEIVLVSHGAFMHYLTEDWEGFVDGNGTAYTNCEWRAFTFTEASSEKGAHLLQVGKREEDRVPRPEGAHKEDIRNRLVEGIASQSRRRLGVGQQLTEMVREH